MATDFNFEEFQGYLKAGRGGAFSTMFRDLLDTGDAASVLRAVKLMGNRDVTQLDYGLRQQAFELIKGEGERLLSESATAGPIDRAVKFLENLVSDPASVNDYRLVAARLAALQEGFNENLIFSQVTPTGKGCEVNVTQYDDTTTQLIVPRRVKDSPLCM